MGEDAVEFAESIGIVLDPWQAWSLEEILGVQADGKWSAFEAAEDVARQNGKNVILEVRELVGLYVLHEKLILHSAHLYPTAQEHFLRIKFLVDNYDHLRKRVKAVRNANGEQGIELIGGQRLRFIARSTGSGRGFTGDTLVFDEAQNLADVSVAAMLPALSARPNPQVIYMFTAPNYMLAPCEPVARLRERALAGNAGRLFYGEWSIDPHTENCSLTCTKHDDPKDPKSWARANPGLGIRILPEHVELEMQSMSAPSFAGERLGVGAWPASQGSVGVISEDDWAELLDENVIPQDPIAFAVDVTPDRSYGSIDVSDGVLVEVVDHRPGTKWIVDAIVRLNELQNPSAVVVDPGSAAGFLIPQLEAAGINIVKPTARDVAQAFGMFMEKATDSKTLRHRGQPELDYAIAGAKTRPLAGASALARKDASVDISPLVAATLALWGHTTHAHISNEPRVAEFIIIGD
jgi:phage terminase large subunit-like protein